jgi:hypothetical protein
MNEIYKIAAGDISAFEGHFFFIKSKKAIKMIRT